MKELYLVVICMVTALAFGQESNVNATTKKVGQDVRSKLTSSEGTQSTFSNSNEDENKPRTYSVNQHGEQIEINKAYYENQLILIDNKLQAFEIKRQYILSNQEELELARSNGWFDNTERAERELREKRVVIQQFIANY